MIQISNIYDRQHRPCNTCIFNPIGTPVLCNANSCYDYNIKDERTGERMKAFINNIYPDFDTIHNLNQILAETMISGEYAAEIFHEVVINTNK